MNSTPDRKNTTPTTLARWVGEAFAEGAAR